MIMNDDIYIMIDDNHDSMMMNDGKHLWTKNHES
jgi:hypothetical protein